MKLNENLFQEAKQSNIYDKVYSGLEKLGYKVFASSDPKVDGLEISKRNEKNLQRAKDWLSENNIDYDIKQLYGRFYLRIPTELNEDLDERKRKRIEEYRKWAQLKDDEPIKEDMIDDWAFKRTCRVCNCTEDKLRNDLTESTLLEDEETTLGAAAKADVEQAKKDIDNEIVADKKSQIESVLDRALRFNKMQRRIGQKNFQNVLFIGEAGTGKSSIIRKWARDNGINLYEVRAAGMDDTDLGGAISKGEGDYSNVVVRLASTEFDKLNRPNSVLFLDEYNRAPKSVRTNLLELVNSHVVPDPRTESGQRYLENFLFTIAAINPANPDYDTDELDMAERTRFKNIDITGEPLVQLKWLRKELQAQIDNAEDEEEKNEALGKLKLAETLLSHRDFEFDNRADIEKTKEEGNGLALNYRTFTAALMGSDGTKEDFLAGWNSYSNNLRKPMIERILRDYKDIDDKANQALSGTESEVFKDTTSIWDRLEKEYLS